MTPRSRGVDLAIQEVDTALIIFDQLHGRAHRLNGIAAAVFKLADGDRNIEEIARMASEQMSAEVTTGVVELALKRLQRARLLVNALPDNVGNAFSRRDLLRNAVTVGGVALVAPLVVSMNLASARATASSRKHLRKASCAASVNGGSGCSGTCNPGLTCSSLSSGGTCGCV